MSFKKSFDSFLAQICSLSNSRAPVVQKRSPKKRRLRFERLENRELLSASSWNDASSVLQESYGSVCEASSELAQAADADDAIDKLLVDAGQNPENLTEKFVFGLSSLPSSTYTIYLDFNGHVNSGGTLWQTQEHYGRITTPKFSLDSDTSSFSNDELKAIYEIWLRVSEDFAPFNVNVTTVEPSINALKKSNSSDSAYGVRVCISENTWYPYRCGGVSYVGSFTENSDTPAYVFTEYLYTAKNIADSVSHETGHTLGLSHDSSPGEEYYPGSDGWAPIMGKGYDQELTQWSKGEYSGATNREDDLAIITSQNGFSYRSDDFGNSMAKAKTISVASTQTCVSGIIERNTDVDFFKFSYNGDPLYLKIGGIEGVTNLDAIVKLYNANGKLLQTFDPTDSTTVSVEMTGRDAGTYYLSVAGTGLKLNGKTIYSNYASLGQYTIYATQNKGEFELVAPTDLTLSEYDPTTRSVVLEWTDNSEIETGFRVEFSLDEGETWNVSEIMDSDVTFRVATSLRANSRYQFRVCALKGKEYSDWAYSEILDTSINSDSSSDPDATSVPDAPSDLTLGVYDATTRRVSLGWKDNSTNETGFRVEFSTDGGQTWSLSENMAANATSRVATGIQTNLKYQFRVRAFNGTKYSDWAYSEILDTSVKREESNAPNAPSALTLGEYNATTRCVSLSWKDNSTSETGFRVEFSKDGGQTWSLSQNMAANVTSRVATGVQANSKYQFRVRAFNGTKYSDWTYSEILDTSVLNAPSALTLGEYNATTRCVSLSWKDNSTNETGFCVEFSTDGGHTWSLSENMAANATSRVATGVQANSKYQFRVRAFNGTKYSDWAYSEILDTSVKREETSAPNAPSNLTLGEYDPTTRSVTLSWRDNSNDETGFRVEFSTDGGYTWDFAQNMRSNVTSRTATNVKNNERYQFRVCAVRDEIRSDWTYSEILDTNTTINRPTETKLGAYDSTTQSVTFSWKDNSTVETGYRVEYTTDGGVHWDLSEITDANVTSRVAIGVKPNSRYQFRVCAVYGKVLSDWAYSEILDTSVKPETPGKLTLSDYDESTRSVKLSWTDNSNAETGFRVEYSSDGGETWNLSEITDAGVTSRVATGLWLNASYQFRVCTVRGDMLSDWTYSEILDTSVKPEAPGNLTLGVYNSATRRVTLGWTDNSNDETGFRVEFSTDGGKTWIHSQTMDANVTSRVATGVQTNAKYQFRVCAVRGNVYSDWTYSKTLNTSVN